MQVKTKKMTLLDLNKFFNCHAAIMKRKSFYDVSQGEPGVAVTLASY